MAIPSLNTYGQLTSVSEYYQQCGPLGCTYYDGYPVVKEYKTTYRLFGGWHYAFVRNTSPTRAWLPYSYEKMTLAGGLGKYITKNWYWTFPVDPSTGNYLDPIQHVYTQRERYDGMKYDVNWALPSRLNDLEQSARGIAISKLYDRLSSDRPNWDAAVSLGEFRETARFITRSASRLYHAYKSFRRGNVGHAYEHLTGRVPRYLKSKGDRKRIEQIEAKAKKMINPKTGFIDDASNAFMEMSFAIRPLISDVKNAAVYLASKQIENKISPRRYRVRHQLVDSRTENGETITCIASVGFTYELMPEWLRNPSTLEELGFTDIPGTLWNLMPLSFVVDYVWNIGQVLESLHEFRQWSVVRGLENRRLRVFRLTPAYSWSSPLGDSEEKPIQSYDWTHVSRTLTGSLPTSVPLRANVSNPFDMQNSQLATVLILLRYAVQGKHTPEGTLRGART